MARKREPLFGAVESATVGYTKIEMKAGKWYMVALPFDALDNGETPTLNTAFSPDFTDGDMAYIFSDGTYGVPVTWTTATNDTKLTWRTGRGVEKEVPLPVGSVVYFHKSADSTITVLGRVNASATISFGKEGGNGWDQIGHPFPQKIKLNEMGWSDNLQDGDELYIFEDGAYKPARYWKAGTSDGDRDYKWRTGRGAPANDEIEVGQALYIHKVSAGVGSLAKGTPAPATAK